MKLVFKSVVCLALFFILIIFLSLYPPNYFAKSIVKNNKEYFIENNNSNKYLNLYFDFVLQMFFQNNFLINIDNLEKISKETKNFLVDQDESYFYIDSYR